jgi:hypothetical protein
MNLEIFKQPDPSGKLGKESYVLKNYPDEYNFIISFCLSNNLEDLPFKQKVYHVINNIKEKICCKNPNCDNLVGYRNSTLGYREYCSNKCISSDPNIKKIKEEKSIQKWGTKTPAESNIIKEKIIKTNLDKYGANSPMLNEDIQKKSKETLLLNWGVDNPSKNIDILKRRTESFKNNIDSYKESYKKTSMDRYGVEHPWSNPDIHSKTIDRFYSYYEDRINCKLDKEKYKFIGFKKNDTTQLLFNCIDCSKNFDILTYQFYYRSNNKIDICTNCHPISDSSSIKQNDLFEFISNTHTGDINENIRDIIYPYEIDVFLEDKKIGFEFNGLFWHSSKFKDKNYHKNKYEKSLENNIQLITIWEDDWTLKQDIIKSFILNKLDKTPNRIFARNCSIKEVSYKESQSFLDDNHLQGDCKSSIRIGLYFENNLVSLMTFSKLRLPLSQKNTGNIFELTRFCNKTYYSVVGGASRLLDYFIKKYTPEEIHTYSDNMISDGGLYQKLGFEYQHTSNPGYWYVVNGIRKHRFNFRKHKLVKNGFDSYKTEEEIMSEQGYFRVYNSGNKKWILKLN